MTSTSFHAYEKWLNRHVVDNDGHRVGVVADVYIDDASGYPEWLAVVTGLFGTRISFVPVSGAVEAGGKVCVAFSKAFVKDSPNIDTGGALSVEDEERLYRHYGMKYATLVPADDVADGSEVGAGKARRRLRRRHERGHDDIDLRETPDRSSPS